MRTLMLVTLLFIFSEPLLAQFNDSTFYQLRYAATGIVNHTNDASSYAITNRLKFSVKKKTLSFNSNSAWVYGKQQQLLTNNDFSSALDVNWYRKDPRFYYWGLGTYETSYSLKVNKRLQGGIGAAYSPVDKKDFYVNISEGILYELADLKLSDTTNDVYNTFRNSFRFRFKYVYKLISLENTSFFQNSFSQKSDYIINSNTIISIQLMKWISLTSSLNYNKVNRNSRENLLLTFGLTAEKYF